MKLHKEIIDVRAQADDIVHMIDATAKEKGVQKSMGVYSEKEAYTHTALNGKKILLAEDHPLNAEIAKKLLEKEGCEGMLCGRHECTYSKTN